MVFQWNLRDSKSRQVSMTLHSILAVLNSSMVLMVPILPLVSNSSGLFSKPLGTVPSAPPTITITFMFHSFVSSPGICLSFHFILFLLCGSLEQQNLTDNKFSFCFVFFWGGGPELDLAFWSGLGDIRLYLKILKNFIRLILSGGFWFVHIPFDNIVKF